MEKELKITEEIPGTKLGDMYYVESKNSKQVVTIKKIPGRTEIHCTCMNGTTYHNYSVLCKHKIAVIIHRYLKQNKLKLVKNE